MTTTMARARRATARWDMTTTTMATGNNNNDVDGDSATVNEVDDDGDGAMGDDNNDNEDGDEDDDGNRNSTMGSGVTGYDDYDDVLLYLRTLVLISSIIFQPFPALVRHWYDIWHCRSISPRIMV